MKSRLPLSRLELSAAAGEVCSTVRQKKWVEESLKLLIKEVWKQKNLHNFVIYPDVQSRRYVRRVVTGSRWQNQKRQRRRISLHFPTKGRGTPRLVYADYLVIKLGEIYVRAKGQKPTRGGTSGILSCFERFARPCFDSLGIPDFRNRVRAYISWRKSQGL